MKIFEVITEEEKSTWQSIKDYGAEVGSELKNMPGALADVGKSAAKSTGEFAKKAIDPEEVEKFKSQMARGWEASKKDPMKALGKASEIAQAAGRGALNTATFGYGDQALAAAKTVGSAFDKPITSAEEWNERFGKEKMAQNLASYELKQKHPIAHGAGEIGGLLVNPAFLGGAKAARYAAGKVLPGTVQKAFTPVAGQTTKNIGKQSVAVPSKLATDIAGGVAATKAVEKGVQKYDPENPYAGEKEYRVFEERLKYLINYR